ncbi:MAG: hypothetical protein A3D74_02985 [Candidatus Levybacteria bacterium RIFCSPHIGHO2_02_FULL_37_13]|nr:MAG: hypothetical protein A3D74_02985 [Candidatus Levybacteria bacterium RIFCSPHIGHO2_02_FULL_37_13]OGH30660.1 MAG: hypothetical protein A3E40_04845 [Candidatus Levybacteria bacterium RIFCSPHIGHO2_12_FULL_37_9]OGH39657.1 MAG: hypothetical protein A3B41_03055 [Candidatus Levybacteria bacterium RIFCSPLOWO2_01_FULL_37_26]
MNRQKTISIALVIIAYIISASISYALSSQNTDVQDSPASSSTPNQAGNTLGFDETLPKTESCPLNGEKYSKKQKEWWEQHRPLGVMIENHEESRPQSGLSYADVVYEAVAEGGITRFLAIFYCNNAGSIGPVRSARTYFLDWVSEYGDYPLYAHVGGANTLGPANALGQIADYEWNLYNDLSQFNLSYPTFKRVERPNGRDVATEHTMFSSTEELWKVAKLRKLTNVNEDGDKWDDKFVKYSFKEDAKVQDRPAAQKIHLELWEDYKEYAIDWIYDKVNNVYKRNNAGKPHIDRITNKQLTAKNIIVLVMTESRANDGYEDNVHLLYKTKGTGKAYVFMDGKQVVGRWEKDGRTARTEIYDNLGESIEFNAGAIWFEILPSLGVIDVS